MSYLLPVFIVLISAYIAYGITKTATDLMKELEYYKRHADRQQIYVRMCMLALLLIAMMFIVAYPILKSKGLIL